MTFYTFKCPECKKENLLDVNNVDICRTWGGCTIAYERTTSDRKYWCEKCGGKLELWNIV